MSSTDLSVTTNAFRTRIKRKQKEQQEAQDIASQEAYQRHALMLHSMMHLRSSLRDLEEIDLGDRFFLKLSGDDWLGWPRIQVSLKDIQHPEKDYPEFSVLSHDRNSSGTIEIHYHPNEQPEKLLLQDKKSSEKLPNVLRKCVRTFLDHIGEIVLQQEHQGNDVDDTDNYIAEKSIDHFEEESHDLLEIDNSALFEEERELDMFETLPSIEDDDIDTLPDL